jgi:transcriptional regulator with XRE-family HTH domain
MRIESPLNDEAVLAELGRRLARTRLERNLSQQSLAHEAGVSKVTIERLEAGTPVKSTSLVRVLRSLGLLDALDRLIPEPLPSPVERQRLQGRRRQRARGGDRREGSLGESKPWRWGDEREGDR